MRRCGLACHTLRSLLLLSGITLLPAAGAAPATEALLADCIEAQFRTDTDEVFRDVRLKLREVCPRLARVLQGGDDPRLTDITPRPGINLTLAQLQDLQRALGSYHSRPATAPPLDRALLEESIANSYEPVVETPKEPTLFERFDKWFNSLFDNTDPDKVRPVVNFFEALGLTREAWNIILQVLVVLLIAFTLFVIFNELRAGGVAGLLQRLRFRAMRLLQRRAESGTTACTFSWSQLDTMSPRQRVVALLRHELRLLMQNRLISQVENRTNREIARQLATAGSPCAEGFGRLAPLADRVLYSTWQPADTELQDMEDIVRQCEREAGA